MGSDRFSFLLRMWREGRSGADRAMRGSLQRVDSDRVQYFESLDRLVEILRDTTGLDPGVAADETFGQGEGE